MDFSSIPAELQALPQWVAHGSQGAQYGDRGYKIPFTPGKGGKASATNPASWGDFVTACADAEQGRRAGIGFEFAADGGLVGVDFDHCIDNGRLDPAVAEWVERFDSYTELSMSGAGLHIICRGVLPGGGVKKPLAEMYDRDRYFAVTGEPYGAVRPIRLAQGAIDALYAKLAPKAAVSTPTMERKPVALTDEEIIQKALRDEVFRALWVGDVSGYPSHSEADMALCNKLAFWTNGDPERVDRLFRRSGLMREKWDSRGDYGLRTVSDAVRTMTSGYDPEEYRMKQAKEDFATPPSRKEAVESFSAADLQLADLGDTRYIVVDLLPQGLSLLTSPPKYGKSWMVLDLCLAVADGTHFLGHETQKCGCWYLALEDSPRRLQRRMNKLLGSRRAPKDLRFTTTVPDLSNGLLDELENHMKQHPNTGLIVIDTLQKVRGQAARNESAYNYDYREIGTLKAFADRHGILLLLVHHLRKMADDTDPHNRISGTNGIMGAADTSLVLSKAKRADENAVLSVVGRDVESSDTVMKFDTDTCKWQPIGSAEWYEEQEGKQKYLDNPLRKTIKTLLEQNGGHWKGTMSELMNEGRKIAGCNLADTPKALSDRIKAFEGSLYEYDRIMHETMSNGTASKRHYFYSYTVGVPADEKL